MPNVKLSLIKPLSRANLAHPGGGKKFAFAAWGRNFVVGDGVPPLTAADRFLL
jgi:hypothetical protein